MSLLAANSEEIFADSPLVLGGTITTNKGTLITGQNLTAGTVLGRITASGKLTKADQDGVDGSALCVGILTHDVNATSADKDCQYYCGGDFNSAKLTWDAGFTSTLQKSAFDRTPITIRTIV